MQTIQISPTRNLFSALKDLVPDVTMIIDKNGMKIINFDKNHTTLVAVKIKFEKHECIPDKIVVCANSLHLFKLNLGYEKARHASYSSCENHPKHHRDELDHLFLSLLHRYLPLIMEFAMEASIGASL